MEPDRSGSATDVNEDRTERDGAGQFRARRARRSAEVGIVGEAESIKSVESAGVENSVNAASIADKVLRLIRCSFARAEAKADAEDETEAEAETEAGLEPVAEIEGVVEGLDVDFAFVRERFGLFGRTWY